MAGAIERLVKTMQSHNVLINEDDINFVEFEDVIYSIAYTEES